MKIERNEKQFSADPIYKFNRFAWKVLYRSPSKKHNNEISWCVQQFDRAWSYTPQTLVQAHDDRWIYWFITVEQVVLFKLRWGTLTKEQSKFRRV